MLTSFIRRREDALSQKMMCVCLSGGPLNNGTKLQTTLQGTDRCNAKWSLEEHGSMNSWVYKGNLIGSQEWSFYLA